MFLVQCFLLCQPLYGMLFVLNSSITPFFLFPLLISDVTLSFNATDFLERLSGKRLVFVGDSLNRNMWESMVCILRHGVRNKARVHEISGKREFKKGGFYAFRFEASF